MKYLHDMDFTNPNILCTCKTSASVNEILYTTVKPSFRNYVSVGSYCLNEILVCNSNNIHTGTLGKHV